MEDPCSKVIPTAKAQAPLETNPGQFFLIEEPIDSEVLERIKAYHSSYYIDDSDAPAPSCGAATGQPGRDAVVRRNFLSQCVLLGA